MFLLDRILYYYKNSTPRKYGAKRKTLPIAKKIVSTAMMVAMILGTFPADVYLGGLIVSTLQVVDITSMFARMKTAEIPSWQAT